MFIRYVSVPFRPTIVMKSKHHAIFIVIAGLIFALAYKIWKFYLRNYLGLDPSQNYFEYEELNTLFRIVNSIFAIGACLICYTNRRKLFLGENTQVRIALLLYPLVYLCIKVLFGNIMSAPYFFDELIINIFVGISEELIFRGCVFGGLWLVIGFWPGCILSSFLFSIWHFDVVSTSLDFIYIFFASLVYVFGFVAQGGLFMLFISHFLWDQICYGIQWAIPITMAEKITLMVIDVIVILIIQSLMRRSSMRSSSNISEALNNR